MFGACEFYRSGYANDERIGGYLRCIVEAGIVGAVGLYDCEAVDGFASWRRDTTPFSTFTFLMRSMKMVEIHCASNPHNRESTHKP